MNIKDLKEILNKQKEKCSNCMLMENFDSLQKELEEVRQIVNTERHGLIVKKFEKGITKDELARLDYLQKKIVEWWPRATPGKE